MHDSQKLSVKEKLAYGIGDYGINIAYTTLGFYIIFFLVNVAGLPAGLAGLIFLVARGWDALTDYLMGVISDRTVSRFGRRRVYLLFGAIPMGISFFLLWITPFESTLHKFIYYLVATMMFNTAFTVVSIPYNAMVPDLSGDYDERTSIMGYRMGLTFVGNLFAAAGVAVIVDSLYGGKAHYRESYPVMGIIFGIIMAVCIFITFFGTRERVRAEVQRHVGGLRASLKTIMALKEFRIILGMFLFNMIGFDLIQAIFIFYLKDVIMVSEDMTFVIMGIPLVVAVVAAPLWVYLGRKLGKNKSYIVAALYLSLVFLVSLFIKSGQLNFIIVVAVLAGVGISATQIIPFSIIPDVIEIDEYENGVRREGAFYGVTMFLYKVASAVAISIASGIIGMFGYVENSMVPQPESALWSIRLLMGIGPGLFFMVSAVFVRMLPITRERFDRIREELEARRAASVK
ncbi:MAG TPA: MFS transporter [Spirochaetes bacterium]|nr:MFS transporter [Spirochaetota bacterium]